MRKLLCCMGLSMIFGLAVAQTMVTGIVKDAKTNQPIMGVSIKVQSTKLGTTSDNEGAFKISVKSTDYLEITMIGYKAQTIAVSSSGNIAVSLEANTTELSEIVFVGTRGGGRVKTESPVPVDVIKLGQVQLASGQPDLTSIMNVQAPSFNYNKQSGGDGSDAIDLATLRGLGPDQTLVLINGKREHTTAFVSLFGTRGRGASGTDLNAIPIDAIDRVEILRDGASAQYGSDAIAGVINIILKKTVNHLSANIGYSGYYDHKYNSLNAFDPSQYYTGHQVDGNTGTFGINYGLPIGKFGGFLNLTGSFRTAGKTFRAQPDTNVMTNPKALPINTIRRAFGDASVIAGGGMFNMEIPLAESKTTFYAFGGYNYKNSNAYAYTRNFSGAPQRFPTGSGGNLIFVPGIMHVTKDSSETFYDPQENVNITDYSISLGAKGSLSGGWDWDLSNTLGYNDFHYHGEKTFNASLDSSGVNRNNFDDGGFNFLQNTVNLGFDKHFSSVGHGLGLAFGAEYRYENYRIYPGEPASYELYDQTKAAGSQGFPGFQPADVCNATRSVIAGYADAEWDVTTKWLLDGAVRAENYTDFGFVSTYKLASRYKISDDFNLRGSISTGFRAPSLQQINFSNTETNILGGVLTATKIIPNYSPVARIAGIPALQPEKSANFSLGFSWKPTSNLTITADAYLVYIKNRVVLSGQFSASDTTLPPALIDSLNAINVEAAQFFVNAVTTTNIGLDLVVDYVKRWSGQRSLHVTLAGNGNNLNIDQIHIPADLNTSYLHQQTFYSTREQAFLIASAPKAKASLQLDYAVNKLGLGLRFTYFGKLTTQGFGYSGNQPPGSGGPGDPDISGSGNGYDPMVTTDDGKSVVPENFVFHGKVTTDIYASYKLTRGLVWMVGIDNLFNVHPDQSVVPNARYMSAYDSESGGNFDAVQMGFNGLRIFTRLALNL